MGIVSLLLAVILPGCKKEEKPETTKAQESTSAETSEETIGDPQFARGDAVFISDTAVYFVFVHGPADQKEQVQETLQKILAVY